MESIDRQRTAERVLVKASELKRRTRDYGRALDLLERKLSRVAKSGTPKHVREADEAVDRVHLAYARMMRAQAELEETTGPFDDVSAELENAG